MKHVSAGWYSTKIAYFRMPNRGPGAQWDTFRAQLKNPLFAASAEEDVVRGSFFGRALSRVGRRVEYGSEVERLMDATHAKDGTL